MLHQVQRSLHQHETIDHQVSVDDVLVDLNIGVTFEIEKIDFSGAILINGEIKGNGFGGRTKRLIGAVGLVFVKEEFLIRVSFHNEKGGRSLLGFEKPDLVCFLFLRERA